MSMSCARLAGYKHARAYTCMFYCMGPFKESKERKHGLRPQNDSCLIAFGSNHKIILSLFACLLIIMVVEVCQPSQHLLKFKDD